MRTAYRPTLSIDSGGTITPAPSSIAFAAAASVSSTAKYASQ